MGLFLSIILGFVPMLLFAYFIYWLDRYEKEPGPLLGISFTWGTVIAAGTAFLINTLLGAGVYLFTESEATVSLTTASLIAPVVEESLKGLAVFLVYLLMRHEFDSILDGIVYASITALGFAAAENAYYIYNYGYLESGWWGLISLALVRIVLVGWQHPFFTSFFGIGLAMRRLNPQNLIGRLAPACGWCLAILTHSVHNTLSELFTSFSAVFITTSVEWLGWLAMLVFIIGMIRRERKIMIQYLADEVQQGAITPAQYQTACSAAAQGKIQLKALLRGQFRQTKRFYQLCAELAHKKNQFSLFGEETGNSIHIQNLKAEIIHLSPTVMA